MKFVPSILYVLVWSSIACAVDGPGPAEAKFTSLENRALLVTPARRSELEDLFFVEGRDPDGGIAAPDRHAQLHRRVLELVFGPVVDVQMRGDGHNWYNGILGEYRYEVFFDFKLNGDSARMTCRTQLIRGAFVLNGCRFFPGGIYFVRTPGAGAGNDLGALTLSQDRLLKGLQKNDN